MKAVTFSLFTGLLLISNLAMANFMDHVYNGEYDKVKELIEQGSSVNMRNRGGRTALMVASQRKHLDVVKLLLGNEAKLELVDKSRDYTALFYAIESKEYEIIKAIVEAGANVSHVARGGWTAVHHLTVYPGEQSLEIFQLLKENGADIHAKDQNSLTPFIRSAGSTKNIGILEHYLSLDIDIEQQDDRGNTALLMATRYGNAEAIYLLVEYGAKVNPEQKEGEDIQTPLQSLAAKIEPAQPADVFRFLIDNGADVNAVDSYGRTALFRTAYAGNAITTYFLLKAGADATVVDKEGNTPLIGAAEYSFEATKLLIEAGADVNIGKDYSYPLARALDMKQYATAQLLIDSGAKTDLILYDSETLLTFVISYTRDQEALKLLIKNKVDLDFAPGESKETVLMYAATRGNLDVVMTLVEAGANVHLKNASEQTAYDLAEENQQSRVMTYLKEKMEK